MLYDFKSTDTDTSLYGFSFVESIYDQSGGGGSGKKEKKSISEFWW